MNAVKTRPAQVKPQTEIENATATGLCVTCRNETGCMYPRNSEQTVHQCEEFEAFEYPFWMEKGIDPTAETRFGGSDKIADPIRASLKGLCRTCAVAETCTYPKHESGVWHCEEFE